METRNFIDFHCHLDDEMYDSNRRELIDECFDSGLGKLVTIADPFEAGSVEKTREMLDLSKDIFAMIAAHPHHADSYGPDQEKKIFSFLKEGKLIAIGETGLDFHYHYSTPENQLKVFKRQIAIARESELPLVIHSREAESRVLKTLEAEKFLAPVVFHCYSGSREDADEILKKGYYLSISGIVTFKKAQLLQEIVKSTRLDKLFTETDSPYLSPEPFRGKTNFPYRVKLVAEKIARIKGIPLQEVTGTISKNFDLLFSKKSGL
jgi:TatD DNase family protein